MLAEDNPINALLTRELLRRRGHQVTEVTSGDGAVQAMETGTFDIVLTDIHMPGMDGIEATRAIRADETASGGARTPIIALTADALETGKRACKDAGMDGFLTKPVDPAQLDDMFNIFFPPPPTQNAHRRRMTRMPRLARTSERSPPICSPRRCRCWCWDFRRACRSCWSATRSAIGCATKARRWRRSASSPGSASPIR